MRRVVLGFTPADISAGVAALAATLLAAGYLVGRVRRWFSALDKLERLITQSDRITALIERELEHNSGSSLKDDVHGIAMGLHTQARRIDRLEDSLSTLAVAQTEVWPAIKAVAEAAPPEGTT